jgi:hypothetical protein
MFTFASGMPAPLCFSVCFYIAFFLICHLMLALAFVRADAVAFTSSLDHKLVLLMDKPSSHLTRLPFSTRVHVQILFFYFFLRVLGRKSIIIYALLLFIEKKGSSHLTRLHVRLSLSLLHPKPHFHTSSPPHFTLPHFHAITPSHFYTFTLTMRTTHTFALALSHFHTFTLALSHYSHYSHLVLAHFHTFTLPHFRCSLSSITVSPPHSSIPPCLTP